MTGFIGICAFVCICSSLIILISKREKELSVLISSVIYILVMLYVITCLNGILDSVKSHLNGLNSYPGLNLLIKMCGIGIMSATASCICEGEGQKGLSIAVEIFAMVEILRYGLPLVFELFSNALKLLGE